jgi:cell division protein FtsW (lipid II flippase)
MSAFAAAAYRFWAMIVFVAVLVQIGAAGYGAFYADKHANSLSGKKFDHGFGLHIALGYILFLATLLLLIFALAARLDRKRVLRALALFGLVLLAIVLALAGHSVPAVGALHPIDALAVVGLSGYLAHSARRTRDAAAPHAQEA